MFSPRQIIYTTPFYFKNGNTPKPKYFIVLANDGKTVIACLPTRTNNVPSFVTQVHGCINLDERCYNAYVFESGKVIEENGFFFPDPKPTFVYGDQVDVYELEMLESQYAIEGVDYEVKGVLKQEEFEALIKCLQSSHSVKRKIKRMLPNL